MNVSTELKQQVETTVMNTVAKIEQLYKTKFSVPVQIKYDIDSARLGGQANANGFFIRLNPAFLTKYKDEYIKQTVVHEVAHLGCHQVYHIDNGMHINAHGPEWKNMMVRLGADPSRCHTYQADEGQGRQQPKFGYVCGCCNKPIAVGPKIHKKIARGAQYTTKCCKSPLVYKGAVGAVPNHIAKQRIAANDLAPTTQVTSVKQQSKVSLPSPTSKLGKCYALYQQYHSKQLCRPQWIQLFVNSAECTPAGASTYLSTCVKLFDQHS